MNKWIYQLHDSNIIYLENKLYLFGNKATKLSELYLIDIPTPRGIIITSELTKFYLENNNTFPLGFVEELEREMNSLFGNIHNTTKLFSARSSSVISMPGMLETITNIGFYTSCISKEKNSFLNDCYKRFIYSYANAVLDNNIMALNNRNMDFESMLELLSIYKIDLPSNPLAQIINSIAAVIKSWNSTKAQLYRSDNKIEYDNGIAVIIQEMIYGNRDNDSGTGVVFSRNPISGEKLLYGEYLINAQGEEIVSGAVTPLPISVNNNSMQYVMPRAYSQLESIVTKLEMYYKDIQDIEFTVESGKLYILQTRNAKRSPNANIKASINFVEEKIITEEDALEMITGSCLDKFLYPKVEYEDNTQIIAKGIPCSPGASIGKVNVSSNVNKTSILFRNHTVTEDIHDITLSAGAITSIGGATSHAAVVTRGLGIPCISGANFCINKSEKTIIIGEHILHEGDIITIDGDLGNIIKGETQLSENKVTEEFLQILRLSQKHKSLDIYVNAETVQDMKAALSFGVEGVGLCRTEHMFFNHIEVIRRVILFNDLNSLKSLLNIQIQEFTELFLLMQDKPFNIRLLDPPLHEFLPHSVDQIDYPNIDREEIEMRVKKFKEVNPMLGKRGVRISILYPEIYKAQIRAIFISANNFLNKGDIIPNIEIMIPFVSDVQEVIFIKSMIHELYEELECSFEYKIGAMIEIPRAAICAGELAKHIDYFSFGTNDLTQMTYGISRDDSESIIISYKDQDIMDYDPFQKLDIKAVGTLMKMAVGQARLVNPKIKIGACGENIIDEESMKFCYNIGLDYVSCSAYKIPRLKLLSSHIKIQNERI